jgi:hypothetical protein
LRAEHLPSDWGRFPPPIGASLRGTLQLPSSIDDDALQRMIQGVEGTRRELAQKLGWSNAHSSRLKALGFC